MTATFGYACILILLLFSQSGVHGRTWSLSADTRGASFYKDFVFISPETRVASNSATYISMQEAVAEGLASLDTDKANALVLKVDDVAMNTTSRNSIRIQSKTTFGDGIYILDVNHIPSGCGVWPAWWTRTRTANSSQEIDILESINSNPLGPVAVIHTDSKCVLNSTNSLEMTGRLATIIDCQEKDPSSPGCLGYYANMTTSSKRFASSTLPRSQPKGILNYPPRRALANWSNTLRKRDEMERTIFAMQRDLTDEFTISLWSFSATEAPPDLLNTLSVAGSFGGKQNTSISLSTETWRTPNLKFDVPPSTCEEQWIEHYMIINTALCGAWANANYGINSCASEYDTCANQVLNFPGSFTDAYWSLNSVSVFANSNFTKYKNTPGQSLSTAARHLPSLRALVPLSLFSIFPLWI